jgi:hypothetical protein
MVEETERLPLALEEAALATRRLKLDSIVENWCSKTIVIIIGCCFWVVQYLIEYDAVVAIDIDIDIDIDSAINISINITIADADAGGDGVASLLLLVRMFSVMCVLWMFADVCLTASREVMGGYVVMEEEKDERGITNNFWYYCTALNYL